MPSLCTWPALPYKHTLSHAPAASCDVQPKGQITAQPQAKMGEMSWEEDAASVATSLC